MKILERVGTGTDEYGLELSRDDFQGRRLRQSDRPTLLPWEVAQVADAHLADLLVTNW